MPYLYILSEPSPSLFWAPGPSFSLGMEVMKSVESRLESYIGWGMDWWSAYTVKPVKFILYPPLLISNMANNPDI